jgi:hypothetical protein
VIERLLASILIGSLLASCATATQQTVAGGIMMGVGGVAGASAGISLAVGAEASNAANIDVPASPTFIGITIAGLVLFVVGTIFLATGINRRTKEVNVRTAEKTRARRSEPRDPPRARSYDVEELLILTQYALEACPPNFVVITGAQSPDVWTARCAATDTSFRCFRIREERRAQCLPLAKTSSTARSIRRPLSEDDEPIPPVQTSTRATRKTFRPD